jgi:hypothetical protein
LLIVQASQRAEGRDSLLLFDEDPKNDVIAGVTVTGDQISSEGKRFDFGEGAAPNNSNVQEKDVDHLGVEFAVTVAAYAASDPQLRQVAE